MRLKSVHVQKFRNVLDAQSFELDPQVTALVGKNESGKTAILEAIYRINPVHPATFDETAHYPRWRLTADRRSGTIDDIPAVQAVFELEEADLDAVKAVFGDGVLTDPTLTVERYYNKKPVYDVRVDAGRAFVNAIDAVGTPLTLSDMLVGNERRLGNAKKALAALPVPDSSSSWAEEDRTAIVAEITRRLGESNTAGAVGALLEGRLPKMFYFSDYETLPGRINVTELSGSEAPGQSQEQTARALLKLAYTDVSALTDEDFEERTAELEAVSNELTRHVFKYWKQNEDLSIQIVSDKVTEPTGYNGQTAVVRYLDVRVRDARHGFTNNFDQRSNGFKWFFSFLAAFSEFQDYEHGVVVLLDEPALTLHGRAQADFLRYIEEELSASTQVIYTTHSPFMVDASQLKRARIVEDKGADVGSVVSNEALSVGEDSLFPLQAALGYDIAQNLFVGPDNLVLEGTSDYTYLRIVSDYLVSEGRTGLDARWRLLPAGSASNIPTFVALIGKALDVTILVDGSTRSGVQKLTNMVDVGLLTKKRILLTDQYCTVEGSDIEDLFSVGDYLTLYNGAFGTALKVGDLNGTDRIISRISRNIGREFNEHGRPADFLLRNSDKLVAKFSKTTVDNFEALFTAINGTLTP